MANYFYSQHEDGSLANRFNIENTSGEGYDIIGIGDWRELISLILEILSGEENESFIKRLREIRVWTIIEIAERTNLNFNVYEQEESLVNRSTEELIATLLLLRLRRFPTLPERNCPRLFISHRQADKDYALRIAKLANAHGFAYWIDVFDPALQILSRSKFSAQLTSLITACIIEMALINCTHVIACLTDQWRGSMWVPYEYGRVRVLRSLSINACVWLHPNLPKTDFPEYALLGEITLTENEIIRWLAAEHRLHNKFYCSLNNGGTSILDNVKELPTLSDEENEKEKKEFSEWLAKGMPTTKPLTVGPPFQVGKRKRE